MNALLFERPVWFTSGPLVLEEEAQERARVQHSISLTSVRVEPAYDSLRKDPRFESLLAELAPRH